MGFSFEEFSQRKVYGTFDFSDAPNVDAVTQKKEVERSITLRERTFSEEQSDSQVKTLCVVYVDIILIISTIDAGVFVNS